MFCSFHDDSDKHGGIMKKSLKQFVNCKICCSHVDQVTDEQSITLHGPTQRQPMTLDLGAVRGQGALLDAKFTTSPGQSVTPSDPSHKLSNVYSQRVFLRFDPDEEDEEAGAWTSGSTGIASIVAEVVQLAESFGA